MSKPDFSPEEIERGYRISKWHTFNNYECVECQYATLYMDKIIKHIDESDHEWPYPGQYMEPVEDTPQSTEPEY